MTTPVFYQRGPMRGNVYIDGFNLYYGVRSTPYKWLNPLAPTRRLLPEHTINHIH